MFTDVLAFCKVDDPSFFCPVVIDSISCIAHINWFTEYLFSISERIDTWINVLRVQLLLAKC